MSQVADGGDDTQSELSLDGGEAVSSEPDEVVLEVPHPYPVSTTQGVLALYCRVHTHTHTHTTHTYAHVMQGPKEATLATRVSTRQRVPRRM